MVAVRVPATSANLGPGFDTLGLALSLYLDVEMDFADDAIIEFKGEGEEDLKNNPENNLVLKSANILLSKAIIKKNLNIKIKNEIPIGKGLGSSAAAIVAGLFAANKLIGNKFSDQQLIKWAVELEGHADNIVPAVVGGFVTVMLYNDEIYYQKIQIPSNIDIIVVVPNFTLSTEKSRSVIPEKVNIKDTVYNLQRACFLIASLNNKDYNKLDKAMDDLIYQPLRKHFIPGFNDIVDNAIDNGALGIALSGAGPSFLAFAHDNPEKIGSSMQQGFNVHGVESKLYYLKPEDKGLVIVK
ncbi:Homoserine kinase [Candidatus Syntrophocurvum alkaliphilum]|uniref:Homoserine kinase n=1 Tax=Candidatus Syntrophocurvum alkaliphilum TaxID=2293317 RepID=A0A6I6DAJ6_9FIRM|nr:homoserine kinase [Candidatus Syntrophocurvum alkaliphilum]QGT99828.1 Homoserine kinase [Candidatus Syntrophocurvum alkaliphilum]